MMELQNDKRKAYSKGLAVRLQENAASGEYPFHMPGHKRNRILYESVGAQELAALDAVCGLDITEIPDFDNLHDPSGILKECMEYAAGVCGSSFTYFLVNGSSCGNMAAILATVSRGGKLILARNCHKSVYHAITLNELTPCYIVPPVEHFCQAVTPKQVEQALHQNPDAEAVILTSPTYEGVVSDIEGIAQVVHRYRKILIVDEAHGAHFGFHPQLPDAAHRLGADLSIQSVHKTLTGFTQSAVLQLYSERVDRERLEEALRMVQSSSPSYLLMAGLDRAYRLIAEHGKELFAAHMERLEQFRRQAEKWEHFHLYSGTEKLYDPAKLVILCESLIWRKSKKLITGQGLLERLKKEYGLVLEMGAYAHAIAMTSIADVEEGYQRLMAAMLELDAQAEHSERTEASGVSIRKQPLPVMQKRPSDCFYEKKEDCLLRQAVGRIAGTYVYLYPPGIPILVPGEVIDAECIRQILLYQESGFEVKGLKSKKEELLVAVLTEKEKAFAVRDEK